MSPSDWALVEGFAVALGAIGLALAAWAYLAALRREGEG